MDITVEYKSGIYEIKGMLNSKNSVYLEGYFNDLICDSRGIVLSLEKLLGIDPFAVNKVVQLQQLALKNQKWFFIVGRKNKQINDQFEALDHADLLL